MSPALGRLRYFLADAWDEFRHSPGANLLAAATLAAVLVLAAALLVVVRNLDRQLDRWREDVHVDVYLRDDADPARVEELRRVLAARPGVVRVTYVGKAEALARFRQSFGDLARVAGELGENPLPASFEAHLDPGPGAPAHARGLADVATGMPGVEEVRFDREWLDRLRDVLEAVETAGTALGVLVFGAVAFVMASVLRLAVLARRDEIDIMLLVGAGPGFVRGPFLVAGLVQGILAAGAALGVVELARRALLAWGGVRDLPMLGLMAGRGLEPSAVAALMAAGAVVGLAGAFVAVRRYA